MPIPSAALRQRITIRPKEGHGAYGPIFGNPIHDVPARFVGKRTAVRKKSGTDVIAVAVADVRPEAPAAPEGSEITHAGQGYVVLDVQDITELARPYARRLILDGGGPGGGSHQQALAAGGSL